MSVSFLKNEILISFAVDHVRAEFLPWAKEFVRMGYTFVGTPGTAEYYGSRGVSHGMAPIYSCPPPVDCLLVYCGQIVCNFSTSLEFYLEVSMTGHILC